MAVSAFADKSKQPSEPDLQAMLAGSYAAWSKLKQWVGSKYGPVVEEWKFSGKSYGWGMRLKQKERIILYMTPCEGHFLVAFVLGDKAIKAAREAGLPAAVIKIIDSARKYAEGTGFRLPIKKAGDLGAVEKLAEIKMA